MFKLHIINFPLALFLLSWLDIRSGHGTRSPVYLMPQTMTKSLPAAYGTSTLITQVPSPRKTVVEGEWTIPSGEQHGVELTQIQQLPTLKLVHYHTTLYCFLCSRRGNYLRFQGSCQYIGFHNARRGLQWKKQTAQRFLPSQPSTQKNKRPCIHTPFTFISQTPWEAKPDYGVIFKKSQFCGRQGRNATSLQLSLLLRIGQRYKARGNKQP